MHLRIEPIANIAAKIWNKIPNEIQEAKPLQFSKAKLKNGFQRVALVGFEKHMLVKWDLYNYQVNV